MGFFQNWTEGGQTWAHRVRMFRQVLRITVFTSLLCGGILLVYQMTKVEPKYYIGTWYYIKAEISKALHIETVWVKNNFWKIVAKQSYSQKEIDIPVENLLLRTIPIAEYFKNEFLINLKFSLYGSILFSVFIAFSFFLRGKATKFKKHISGKQITSAFLLKLRICISGKASPIKLGNVPFINNSETQHFLITGGTGSGKTNCMFHLLHQIRQQNQKALVVDSTGDFVKKFFNEKTDTLLNPFHALSVKWHPWVECDNRFDYESMAESFIPQSTLESENYWRQASRTLLSSVLQILENSKKNSELTKWLLREPLNNLCEFVEGTKAAAHMDSKSEKTASSIRSVATVFVDCLENLQDTTNPFSIKKWVFEEKNSGWIFLQTSPSQRAALNPLISTWISVAIRSLLNLHPSLNRRLWFFLDELASLNKVKDLTALVTEGRKYGGCGVLALQSIAQLEEIYGRENAKVLIGNCLTKLIFCEQDPEIALRISKMFGEREVKEYHEGLSYGAHETRDGVNLSTQLKSQAIVTPTMIQSLKKNNLYLGLPENYPIAKIKLDIFKG